MIIVVLLLILLIFLLGCDNAWVRCIKNKICPPENKLMVGVETDCKKNIIVTENPAAEELIPGDNSAEIKEEAFSGGSGVSPSTWEPSATDFNKLETDNTSKSYAEDLNNSVDKSIVDSHREYTADSDYLATTGSSHGSARDDFMPAVPFHGLPRKAHYAHMGAESGARVAQSETPSAVFDLMAHNSTGYCL
jgi:hypothetical protein